MKLRILVLVAGAAYAMAGCGQSAPRSDERYTVPSPDHPASPINDAQARRRGGEDRPDVGR